MAKILSGINFVGPLGCVYIPITSGSGSGQNSQEPWFSLPSGGLRQWSPTGPLVVCEGRKVGDRCSERPAFPAKESWFVVLADVVYVPRCWCPDTNMMPLNVELG